MSDLSSEVDAAESLMAELADEYVERLERGERPEIDEYVMRWPGDPLILRQALASLKLVRLSSVAEAGEGAVEAADTSGRLGDFQLLREIGRGGMGVVYEAEQHSLGRRVALKLLPLAGMLDPRQLQRFKNEALAAAQLNHPNIVDVISVGCERGVHYYAMRLIDGLTLAQMIAALKRSASSKSAVSSALRLQDQEGSASRLEEENRGSEGTTQTCPAAAPIEDETPIGGDRPKAKIERSDSTSPIAHLSTERPGEYYRSVARLLADAADALDYAHQSGVVHRDVKPSNLMLDSRGKVWVTDFGLARVESNTEMTMTGDVLGTLRYMSPEQASGDRRLVDNRTDVYSLGATLYELLTLQPAFAGSDRRELLRQIAEADPIAPRKIRRSIPADLETIARKALEKDRAHRYASAGALAADLRCFLAGQPIRARSLSGRQRIIRWTQRHVGLVFSIGAALAIALLVSTIAGVVVYRSNQDKDLALDVAERQRREAVGQRRQADDALRVARRAVDRMYTDVATEWLAANGALTGVQEKFLSQALEFYEEFPKDHAVDDEARFQEASTYLRIGELRCQLMKLDEAEQALTTATSLFEQLVSERPGDLDLRKNLAHALKARSVNSVRRGATKEAVAALDRAVEYLRQLVAASPDTDEFRFELTDPAIFDHYVVWGKHDQALRFLNDARRHVEHLVLAKPRDLEFLVRQVELDWRLGDQIHCRNRDYDAAEAVLRQTLALDRSWAREDAEYPRFRWYLSFCADSLGRIYWLTDRLAEAEDSYRLAADIRGEVARRFPHHVIFVHTELLAHRNLAFLLDDRGQMSEADAQWREELVVAERIARLTSPESSSFSALNLIEAHRHLAESSLNLGDEKEAEAHALKMIHYCRRMPNVPAAGGWVPDHAGCLISTCATAGEVFARLGKYTVPFDIVDELIRQPDTEGALVATLRLSEHLALKLPSDLRLDVAERSKLLASALATWSQCLAACDREKMSALECNEVGWLLATSEVRALRDVPRALEFAEAAVRREPDNGRYVNTLGAACYYAGRWDDARANMLRCLELEAPSACDLFFLAMACWQLDQKDDARQWFDKAMVQQDGNRQTQAAFARFRTEAESLLGIVANASDR